eukprot:TRINITY_DN24149_c0_g1_i1.p1 TRINITY_DN24149_c0_g1~~TRINITY_DN24149_c0_g1_i1.p1  ORF type:complete len:264 (+),score=47.39 TRINITY_DN24149_c0_g1_i1:111-902(+)
MAGAARALAGRLEEQERRQREKEEQERQQRERLEAEERARREAREQRQAAQRALPYAAGWLRAHAEKQLAPKVQALSAEGLRGLTQWALVDLFRRAGAIEDGELRLRRLQGAMQTPARDPPTPGPAPIFADDRHGCQQLDHGLRGVMSVTDFVRLLLFVKEQDQGTTPVGGAYGLLRAVGAWRRRSERPPAGPVKGVCTPPPLHEQMGVPADDPLLCAALGGGEGDFAARYAAALLEASNALNPADWEDDPPPESPDEEMADI